MKFAIALFALIAALYLFLVFAPALLFYKVIFKKNRYKADFEKLNEKNKYFPLYAEKFRSAADFILSLKRENFEFKVKDGTLIRGALYGEKSDKTAVFLHGYNTAPLNNFSLQAKALYENGFNIVFIYSRAHGGSGGTSTMGLKEGEDLPELLPFIKEKTGAKQMLVYGMSMGCFSLAYASSRLDGGFIKGIVLDCGFTSPYNQLKEEMIRRHLPVCFIAPLLTFFTKTFLKIDIKQSALNSLKNCKVPALFFHGGADVTVPQKEGLKNFEACAAEKYRYCAQNAAHTLCFAAGGKEAEKYLFDFVKKYFE